MLRILSRLNIKRLNIKPQTHTLAAMQCFRFHSLPTSNCAIVRTPNNQRRSLSTDSYKLSSIMDQVRPYVPTGIAVGGGVVALYGISRIMYAITTTFMSLTPAVSLYYGFIGGTLSSSLACIAFVVAMNARSIPPDHAFRKAFANASRNPQIKQLLGSNIIAGELRTYRATYGCIGIKNGFPTWFGPKVEIVFNIQGKNGEAIVAAIVSKDGYFEKLDYVSVSVLNHGTVSIIGNESSWNMKQVLEKYVDTQHKFTNI